MEFPADNASSVPTEVFLTLARCLSLCGLPFSVLPFDILHSSLLCVAFLRYASLCDAFLRVASLRYASLRDAFLRYAS